MPATDIRLNVIKTLELDPKDDEKGENSREDWEELNGDGDGELERGLLSGTQPTTRRPRKRRRRWLNKVWVLIILMSFGVFAVFVYDSGRASYRRKNLGREESGIVRVLRDDGDSLERFVTSFPYGGLTNQIYVAFKSLYAAKVMNRTALLTTFVAAHNEVGNPPFSEFFDIARFTATTSIKAKEWASYEAQLAKIGSQVLSCWTWVSDLAKEQPLKNSAIEIKYWPTPDYVSPDNVWYAEATWPALVRLSNSSQTEYIAALKDRPDRPEFSKIPPPNEDLLCFDKLFYVIPEKMMPGGRYITEELSAVDPIWTEVATHVHFTPRIEKITDESMVKLKITKPFIGVHMRRGDFEGWGRTKMNGTESLEDYRSVVERMKVDVAKKGYKKVDVVFMTDSEDPQFIGLAQKQGWIYSDHTMLGTVKICGSWCPAILDSSILSRAIGFVGTATSTFSHLAARRVETWNKGVSHIVSPDGSSKRI